jgi:putative Holliday junction resolvase
MGIDYGTKRTGIAVTDPLQIIASGLTTIPTHELFDFLTEYFQQEEVEKVVVGEPMHKDGNPAQIAHMVVGFVRKLKKQFPQIEVVTHDERGTSVMAKEIILQSGIKQKKRRDKTLVDKIAAALILEDYLKNNGDWSF